MAPTIIYVHGNGNQIAMERLRSEWDHALFGRDLGAASRMAYWARLRYAKPRGEAAELEAVAEADPAQRLVGPEAFAADVLREARQESGVATEAAADDERLQKWLLRMVYDADALANGEAGGPAEALPLPRKLRIAAFRALVKRTFHDVYAYFFGGMRDPMRQVVETTLAGAGGPLVVVGHSLGTIIAYEALRRIGAQANVDLFVTAGSPLGVLEVQDLLDKPLRVPDGVREWRNVNDARDLVALDHRIRPEYAPADRCTDFIVSNGSDNHHGIGEYLATAPIRDVLRPLFTGEAAPLVTAGGLRSVSKPETPVVAEEAAVVAPEPTAGSTGSEPDERSRSAAVLVGKGKSAPIRRAAVTTESVIGPDERVRIFDTHLSPWRMICSLRLTGPTGAGAIGTGWFIGPRTVLTAGHCVFSSHFFGGWASQIQVVPGRNGPGDSAVSTPFGRVTSTRFSAIDRWVAGENADYDIGCIHLAEDQDLGNTVGWFSLAAPPAEDLAGFLLNISGYPGDRGAGQEQYFARNRVLRVTERRVFYEVDTFGGQSGAPVWIHEDENAPPRAIGVHAYGTGGTPADFDITANSAPRITPEVLEIVTEWVQQDGGWPQT
ncbi:trypsin-like serine peptidase [Paractinoplanes lichenicola]|uniref:Serine protease n=1 Tax=Paractinoplanes lichenicola TaxID=2802976 RepID=A0ABS1VNL2_9ACTN|nr:serine protease [Actinoplanes lichenicola]MBL7255719.1 trypsin-like serine protease [Actinoplanes lichenicola]